MSERHPMHRQPSSSNPLRDLSPRRDRSSNEGPPVSTKKPPKPDKGAKTALPTGIEDSTSELTEMELVRAAPPPRPVKKSKSGKPKNVDVTAHEIAMTEIYSESKDDPHTVESEQSNTSTGRLSPFSRSPTKSGSGGSRYASLGSPNNQSSATTADSIDGGASFPNPLAGVVDKPAQSAAKTSGQGDKSAEDAYKQRFVGKNGLQYALWAHWMAYGSSCMCLVMGMIAILWYQYADTYGCKVNGSDIADKYLFDKNGDCRVIYKTGGEQKKICCDPDSDTDLEGYPEIGAVYVVYAVLILLYENIDWGFGLWFPNDTCTFNAHVSAVGISHLLVGAAGLYNYATALPGSFLLTTGAVYSYVAYRQEAGDGGRQARRKARENARAKKEASDEPSGLLQAAKTNCLWLLSFNPVTFFTRIYNEDKLSSYVWVFIYYLVNALIFGTTLNTWNGLVDTMEDDLINGNLDVHCSDLICKVNRKAIRYGPFSHYAPWAKACGSCLNLNCCLILLPVIRLLLRKLNNYGESFASAQAENDILGKFFARPLTRYIPLQKNIEFHKLCASSIFIFSWGHLIMHMLNLMVANNVTLRFFRVWGWDGTDYLSGALISFAMFMIYTAAPDQVRMAKYEVFFKSHHFFIIFFLFLFIHGPVFFYWGCVPVALYVIERYMQTKRGNRPYRLVKVEWIPPVMAIYFRPVLKEDFPFKEGQYLYVNCPYISTTEWHPFTISSASDDLNFGPRIHTETGEEVQEIPRPRDLPAGTKWNKYCLASQDWQQLQPSQYLDKSDTGFHDFVSIHVKVHGLEEPNARTWTRKLKEYFELINPVGKFPFYFYERDARGEIQIGRRNGPDGQQILRIDGPHSAPSEHYTSYGTVMLIGAGIGLTPCASILCALTKYRWRKNFNPELLHFYWVVRQNEIDSFQWLVHMLTELSYEIKRGKATNQIERRYYCEIHVYVTGASKKPIEVKPLCRASKRYRGDVRPTFAAEELYSKLLNPTVSSKGQIEKMKGAGGAAAENRLQDIWIWNGRPQWDEVFKDMKDQRQHSDIGVCFCGAPVIGADLRAMCEKYSDASEQCLFSLHKENF